MFVRVQMIMLFVAVLFSVSVHAEDLSKNIPAWLNQLIEKHYSDETIPVLISEFSYQDGRVFVVDRTKACCDLGATMYNQEGEEKCKFIGFAGAWESKCKNFSANSTLIRHIYKHE